MIYCFCFPRRVSRILFFQKWCIWRQTWSNLGKKYRIWVKTLFRSSPFFRVACLEFCFFKNDLSGVKHDLIWLKTYLILVKHYLICVKHNLLLVFSASRVSAPERVCVCANAFIDYSTANRKYKLVFSCDLTRELDLILT